MSKLSCNLIVSSNSNHGGDNTNLVSKWVQKAALKLRGMTNE